MSRKTRLELTWIGKDERPRLEPRILIEEPSKSYLASTRGKNDLFDNILVRGDNLLALKSLEQQFTGAVKCIYIDPPFNTGAAFEHYDDGVEHSLWLSLMAERIRLLRGLLREDGAIFVHLDDNELDYCKVLLDEIFGRANFINRITIDARAPSAFSTVNPGVFKASEYLLWYAKDRSHFLENSARVAREPDYAYNKWLVNSSRFARNIGRRRSGSHAAHLLQGVRCQGGRLRQSDYQENPAGRARQLRMGPRRLQPSHLPASRTGRGAGL